MTEKYLNSTGLAHLVGKLQESGGGGSAAISEEVKKEIALLAHPVGSYYWSSDKTSPATLFGGEWTPVEHQFVYAAGQSEEAGTTGGAATIALTTAHLPSHTHAMAKHKHLFQHTHDIPAHAHGLANHTHTISHTHTFDHRHETPLYQVETASGSTYINALWHVKAPTSSTVSKWHSNGPIATNSTASSTTTSAASTTKSGTPSVTATNDSSVLTSGGASATGITGNGGAYTADSGNYDTGATGSGTAHDNMPPYITAYCWRRTA